MKKVTKENFIKNKKVKICPSSEFKGQDKKSKYGILSETIENGWVEVQWYNNKNIFMYSNVYRIVGKNLDLYYINENKQLEFDF